MLSNEKWKGKREQGFESTRLFQVEEELVSSRPSVLPYVQSLVVVTFAPDSKCFSGRDSYSPVSSHLSPLSSLQSLPLPFCPCFLSRRVSSVNYLLCWFQLSPTASSLLNRNCTAENDAQKLFGDGPSLRSLKVGFSSSPVPFFPPSFLFWFPTIACS